MNTQLEQLKKLALAATPGPWVSAGPSSGKPLPEYLNEVFTEHEDPESDSLTICQTASGITTEGSADMEYIAAANPAVILQLIEALERNTTPAPAVDEANEDAGVIIAIERKQKGEQV